MKKPPQAGYDAPETVEHDSLDRRRFARGIARLATETPAEWSVRIGVYGEWGSGKTTVLDYVAALVSSQGHIPIRFNPWHAQSSTQLWSDFAMALHEAAGEAGSEKSKQIVKKLRAGELKTMAKAALDACSEGIGKAADIAFDMFGGGRFLTVGSHDVRAVATELAPKRLVVLVDDLDRATPALIPEVLFILREILDCPGFSFVLAFDPKIVTAFLHSHYATDIFGAGFLEKIIDFPRFLPPPTGNQLLTLAIREAGRRCPFVPTPALTRVIPLLPANPRAIKRYTHQLWTLKDQIERHAQHEINWGILLLMQALQSESRTLPEALFRGSPAGVLLELRMAVVAGAQTQKESDRKLRELVEQHVERANTDRVLNLVDALREVAGDWTPTQTLQYHADLLDRPHAVTWKEFGQLWDEWRNSQNPAVVDSWIQKHGAKLDISESSIFLEVWDATLVRYDELLSCAANSAQLDVQQRNSEDAATVFIFLRQLALELNGLVGTPARLEATAFARLVKLCRRWVHFGQPEPYPALRASERQLLADILTHPEINVHNILETLDPWESEPSFAPQQGALHEELLQMLVPREFDSFFALFETSGGPAPRLGTKRSDIEAFLAFGRRGKWWTEERLNRLRALAQRAADDATLHGNFIGFVGRLKQWATELDQEVGAELGKIAWEGMVAQPLQYRGIGSHRETKAALETQLRIKLEVPDWWDAMGPPAGNQT